MHQNLNPLTHMSDQDRIFPYNINTNSTTLVMRIEKNENGRRLEILHRVRVIDEDCTYKTRKHFGNFFRIHGP